MWRILTSALMFLCVRLIVGGDPHHEPTDYCDLLAQDDINGVKHGFMAGNNVVGTFKLSIITQVLSGVLHWRQTGLLG